ncbi:MAG: B12-binding domain-containing radical SAM protein [Xanthobacteraceae bacterium]
MEQQQNGSAHALRPQARNVLLVYPRFVNESFWNYRESCAVVGAKYPTIPLGLITVAAMLPGEWDVRLVNLNTEELSDADLEWADLVMTGGMMFQQAGTLDIIEMCRARGKPVAVGGPDVSSSPHVYERANFRVVGEAESVIDKFIAAIDNGSNDGLFEGPKFQADVTTTPKPRFDLLKFDQYMYLGVQFSRGCPFTCEFCDIIELYGRVPRTKTVEQTLGELDHLYNLGYRGHVDFVDDNLIGNKKAIKAFLPHLIKWQEERDYPFEFSTEASLNLADDDQLIGMLKKANFFVIFMGIESPDTETLIAMRKKQNTRRSISESIHKLYKAGIFVTAGFIVGFDSEKGSIAGPMIELIEEAAIPMAVIGQLWALPNTQLARRLAHEGRLHVNAEFMPKGSMDQCASGLNFETKRERLDILRDFRRVLATEYTPEAYFGRVDRLVSLLDCSDRRREMAKGDVRAKIGTVNIVQDILRRMPEHREVLWRTFTNCMKKNPGALRAVVILMGFYLHIGPYTRFAINEIDEQIAALEQGRFVSPQLLTPPQSQPVAVSA